MTLRRKRAVMLQAVHWIVGRADDLDLHFFQNAVRGECGRGEFSVRNFPDFFGGRLVEQVGDAVITLQFQMRPVIERITERVRNSFGPREKFVVRAGVAGDEFFRDAVGPHRAPFVMVAFEPDFKKVFELAVARDVARRNVAMIIEDRLVRRELVVKFARGLGA